MFLVLFATLLLTTVSFADGTSDNEFEKIENNISVISVLDIEDILMMKKNKLYLVTIYQIHSTFYTET